MAAMSATALLAACGSGEAPAGSSTVPGVDDIDALPAGAWLLTSAEVDGTPLDLPAGVAVTMNFGDGRVTGSNGCNSYGADISMAEDGSITIGAIESTLMGCLDERAEIEQAFMRALASVARFEHGDDGRTVVLVADGSRWTFASDDDGGPAETADGDWIVSGFGADGTSYVPADDWPVTMSVSGTQIGGTAACNGYGGVVDGTDGRFVVGDLSWTEMGCAPEVMEIEQAFLRALQQVDTFEAGETSLRLSGPGIEGEADDVYIDLTPVEPVADARLTAQRWVLDTVLDGDAATNSPEMDLAFVEFDADGSLRGSTGCRLLEGEWQLSGATLQVPVLSAIDDPAAGVCSPESTSLDGVIISVIEAPLQVEIDGRRLTVLASGGDGLSFRADDAG
jgi:heat shock protein HslJ